ncbi:hypothetical protein Trydic_g17138 [Trypoxylus dichotomus]
MTNICNAILHLCHFPSLAAKLPAHQSSSGHEQDCRPDNTRQTAGGIGRPRRYPQLAIRFPQKAQHHSPSAAPRRTHKRGLQPTGMHRGVAKAFDKVWHQGLLLKMHRAGISKTMVKLVHSFLCKRTFQIKLEGRRSTTRTATIGVPQGSAISPLLVNIYTSDIPTTAHVNLAMYADDVCIYSRSLNARVIDRRLQTALDTLRD